MKFLPYIFKHLRSNWIRSSSTAAAIAICIFLFCTLQTFVAALTGFMSQGKTRLLTRHSVSFVYRMPRAYEEQIATVPGVKRVAIVNFFGGVRDLSKSVDSFPNLAIEAENFLLMNPQYILPDEERRAFLADQHGCIIGKQLAEQFHWKVGDSVVLQSPYPDYRPAGPLSFLVRGIYRTDQARYPGTRESVLFFHFQYLYEASGEKVGVSTFNVEIEDPRQAGSVSHAIDALFENSDTQTHTETEAQARASFSVFGGNLALVLNGISMAVVFSILLVTANTMSMAVRERRMEIAVLKTLGFPSGRVMSLILLESAFLGVIGATAGLLLGRFMLDLLPKVPTIGALISAFPRMGLPPLMALVGVSTGLVLGVSAGFLPALFAYKARISDLLREA